MTVEQLIPILTAALPSIIAFITAITTFIKGLGELKKLHKQVIDMKAVEDIKIQLKSIINENYELKKVLNETMTKIDHIERK